jgi:hypothetical protein
MGTSQSSKGPGPGVPMIPPWADGAPEGGAPGDEPGQDGQEGQPGDTPAPAPAPTAPPGRWTTTSRNLGDYARTGDSRAMHRALKGYVRNGYGGAGTASRRMGGTATTAGTLSTVLNNLVGGAAPDPNALLDRAILVGRNADEIMDAVIEAVRPVDGTQDAEASRAAIRDALSELLARYENADLLQLTDEQREFAVERFTANDVVRRFELDTGQVVIDKAPTTAAGLARLKEIRSYIKQTVAASFRTLKQAGSRLSSGKVAQVVRDALRETFTVFEEYVS